MAVRAWLVLLLAGTACAVRSPAQNPGVEATPAPRTLDSSEFWWADRLDPVRFSTPSTSHYFIRSPDLAAIYYFLPPLPPPLHGEIPLFGSLIIKGPPAPPALAPHAYDLFYPALGSWLVAGELPRPLQQRLDAYQQAKQYLQEELRLSLQELKDGPAAERDRRLAVLGESQAPRLAALEQTAEALRRDLLRQLPHGPRTQWRDFEAGARQAGDREVSDSLTLQLEADATILAAFYQDGLAPAQRRLLTETAHEIAAEARGAPVRSREGRWIYFLPDTARVRLPDALPDALEQLVADYLARKKTLKNELREVIRNRELSASARSAALEKLAATQAPPLAALEDVAETIRRELAALPQTETRLSAPALPAELEARIAAYRQHKIDSLRRLHPLLAGSGDDGQPKTSVAEFNRIQNEEVERLSRENAEIREALAAHMRSTGQPGDRRTLDDLQRDFENARQEQESRTKFRDYQAAVLMPGLTAAQRRLLFDAAIAQLGLPLPAGQRMR